MEADRPKESKTPAAEGALEAPPPFRRSSYLRVALYRGKSLVSRAIQWQTRSAYSHAALLLWDGSVIEAWHRGGVALNEDLGTVHSPGTEVDIFAIEHRKWGSAASSDAWAFALQQVGKSYDFSSVLRFLRRCQSRRNESGEWFCSELVFASLQVNGVSLLERIESCDVSPGMLALSPHLRLERTIKTHRGEAE